MTLEMWAGPKAGVFWSMRSTFSQRAVSHGEPWRILSRVGAMVTSLHHRGKLEGRGWARLSTILFPCPEQGTHVSGEQQCPFPRALDLQTPHGRFRKTQRLSEEECGLSPGGLLRAMDGSQFAAKNVPDHDQQTNSVPWAEKGLSPHHLPSDLQT